MHVEAMTCAHALPDLNGYGDAGIQVCKNLKRFCDKKVRTRLALHQLGVVDVRVFGHCDNSVRQSFVCAQTLWLRTSATPTYHQYYHSVLIIG